jgi:hypothetical protein
VSIDPGAVTAVVEGVRGLGLAGVFLAERIKLAQDADIRSDAAIQLMFAEADANLDMLKAAHALLQEGNKGWREAVSLMSTEAMDLVLFRNQETGTSKKLFSKLKSTTSDDANIAGTAAAFFLYRKISALKQIAALQSLVPEVEARFRIQRRIENLTRTTEEVRKILWKTIKATK